MLHQLRVVREQPLVTQHIAKLPLSEILWHHIRALQVWVRQIRQIQFYLSVELVSWNSFDVGPYEVALVVRVGTVQLLLVLRIHQVIVLQVDDSAVLPTRDLYFLSLFVVVLALLSFELGRQLVRLALLSRVWTL